MKGQVWSSILEEVDKVSDVEQIQESGFLSSEQECGMDFTTNKIN